MNMNPAQQQQQRKKQFLYGLGNVMLQRGVPLPPQLTGIPYPPAYDPSTSPWKSLEVSNQDVGVVRIGGKDVDLYRLWGTVLQSGGSAKVRHVVCCLGLQNDRHFPWNWKQRAASSHVDAVLRLHDEASYPRRTGLQADRSPSSPSHIIAA